MRALNVIMTVIFILCVVVQFNDPDPLLWIAIYLYAVVLTGMAAANRYTVFAPVGAAGYLIGALILSPAFAGISNPVDLVTDIRMDSKDVELARESGGLFICSAWMIVLSVIWYRRRKGEEPEAPEPTGEE